MEPPNPILIETGRGRNVACVCVCVECGLSSQCTARAGALLARALTTLRAVSSLGVCCFAAAAHACKPQRTRDLAHTSRGGVRWVGEKRTEPPCNPQQHPQPKQIIEGEKEGSCGKQGRFCCTPLPRAIKHPLHRPVLFSGQMTNEKY